MGRGKSRRSFELIEASIDPQLPSFDAETKRGDPRWRWFGSRYGDRCWELDALSHVILL